MVKNASFILHLCVCKLRSSTEEMSSESGLVESMVSKLCIPKSESPGDGGSVTSPATSPGANPPTSLRTLMMGKRRMCTKADDLYGIQKQRQRLGSADASVGIGRPSDVADELQSCPWKATEFALQPTEHDQSISSKTGVSDVVAERGSRTERSEKSGTKISESRSGCRLPARARVESMDVQSDVKHLCAAALPEVGHQCDGALCLGASREADEPDCKMDGGDEVDASYRSSVSSLPVVSEWKDSRGEMVVDCDPRCVLDDGKGPRLFRRYRKVVGKSGSRSDLLNRLTNASEQGNLASRNSADLDAFFSEMGMDRSAIESALTESQLDHTVSTTSLNVFENISSIGTPLDSRSCTSRDSQPMDETASKSLDLDEQPGLGISVVERNARVIRWLCNIRRVSTVTDDGEV